MSLKLRTDAVTSLTPAADYSAKRGSLVTFASETATVSASATVPATGVILEGNRTTAGYASEKVTVGILGAMSGTVPMRLGGAVTKGELVKQHTDGSVIADAAGARQVVGVALESGVTDDIIEVAPRTPLYYAA